MPLSATASSTQSRPSATLRYSQGNLALFRELAGIAQEIEQNLLEPHGVCGEPAQVLLRFDDESVLVFLGKQIAARALKTLEQARVAREIAYLRGQLDTLLAMMPGKSANLPDLKSADVIDDLPNWRKRDAA